jgi:MFS transporter, AAHS family, benzoate transport protein
LPIQMNFLAFAIPGVIAAVALALVPEKRSFMYTQAKQSDGEKVVPLRPAK